MVRRVLAVIVGYIVIALSIMVLFTLAYLLLGPEGSFQPESYQVSGVWALMSVVVGLLVAILGGIVCAAIARERPPAYYLAGVVVILGLITLVMEMQKDPPAGRRTAEVSNTEAMMTARQPAWLLLLNPLIGGAGVIFGGRLKSPE